jgi:LmbE family N-acetylglucosaminyl deacetylase
VIESQPLVDVEVATSEAEWLAWPDLARRPEAAWPNVPAGDVVIVAPHPDDVILGAGGTMRVVRDLGRTVRVVAVTDGEASHPESRTVEPSLLAEIRIRESERAIERLGVAGCTVDRLAIPDGKISAFEDDLAGALVPLVDGAGLVIAPWEHDGHPDHDATGRAAARAALDAGVPLAQYLVWTWSWARPRDSRVPWERSWRVSLSPATRAAKARAISELRSQTQPLGPGPGDAAVLTGLVLPHHRRTFEVLLA